MLATAWRHLVCVLPLTVLPAAARAESLRVLPLQHTDAQVLAAYLGAISTDPDAHAQSLTDWFVTQTVDRAVRQADGQAARWEAAAAASLAPDNTGKSFTGYLAGLADAPLPLPDDNALLVRGTIEAIDRVAELVRMLDKPTPMVAVEVRLLGGLTSSNDDWSAVPDLMNGDAAVCAGDVAPGMEQRARWGQMTGQVLLADELVGDRSRELASARVTTLSGVPAMILAGQALPVFQTRSTYDTFGQRVTETQATVVFLGLELTVAPRVIGEDQVVMRLRPALTSWAGEVPGPQNATYPVTRRILAETQVRVRSGESLVLGNWERSAEGCLRPGVLSTGLQSVRSDVTMVVTPVIIREPQADPAAAE